MKSSKEYYRIVLEFRSENDPRMLGLLEKSINSVNATLEGNFPVRGVLYRVCKVYLDKAVTEEKVILKADMVSG